MWHVISSFVIRENIINYSNNIFSINDFEKQRFDRHVVLIIRPIKLALLFLFSCFASREKRKLRRASLLVCWQQSILHTEKVTDVEGKPSTHQMERVDNTLVANVWTRIFFADIFHPVWILLATTKRSRYYFTRYGFYRRWNNTRWTNCCSSNITYNYSTSKLIKSFFHRLFSKSFVF